MKSETVNDPAIVAAENDNENFYESLPRFVTDQPTEAIGGDLSPIDRIVEYDGKQFVLTIVPGRVTFHEEETGGLISLSRLPGDFERQVEEALRVLADAANVNYDRETHGLASSFNQLRDFINWLAEDDDAVGNDAVKRTNRNRAEITKSRIEIALSTLCSASYILKCGEREFYFHPIDRLNQIEKDGEIYYQIFFTQVFFSDRLFRQFLWD